MLVKSLDRSQDKLAAQIAEAERLREEAEAEREAALQAQQEALAAALARSQKATERVSGIRAKLSRLKKQKEFLDEREKNQSRLLEEQWDAEDEAALQFPLAEDGPGETLGNAPVASDDAPSSDVPLLQPDVLDPGVLSPGFLQELGWSGIPPTSQGS